MQNLENGVKRDSRSDSSILLSGTQPDASTRGNAHWGEDGIYWRWSDGGVEGTAFALRALLAIDPKNPLIEPVTNWIIRNRRGAQWSNTRDTAMTVLALNDYLRQSGELAADAAYEVRVNGQTVANRTVNASDVLSAPSQFEIDRKLILDGANEIRILRKGGNGPLYFATQARFFSLEEPVSPAGSEIFVRRQYYRLASRPTLLKGSVTEKLAFKEGDKLTSGDSVEVVLTVEAKNNYEYLVFEDLKPAGLEAVQIRSGGSLFARELKSSAVTHLKNSAKPPAEERVDRAATARGASSLIAFPLSVRHDGGDETSARFTGRNRWVYQELRDRKVALFIDKLPEGVWEIRYELRAEVPGEFHALPVLGHAMYVPEIRCNGEEQRVCVLDR